MLVMAAQEMIPTTAVRQNGKIKEQLVLKRID